MRQLPLVLLNLVVVLVAVLLYDRLRVEESAPPGPDVALREAVGGLNARLTALEERVGSGPGSRGDDTRLFERLAELERRMGRIEGTVEAETPPAETPASGAEEADAAPQPGGEPSPEEVQEFRKLAAAARREELARRSGRLVDATLKELGMSLTEDQRDRLVRAYLDFQPRRDEIWREAKARGSAQGTSVNWDTIIAETTGVIEREFTEVLSGFLHISDAEAVSSSLNSRAK